MNLNIIPFPKCRMIYKTGATSGAGIAKPSGAPEFTSGFSYRNNKYPKYIIFKT
jgi:hypothetical protein